MSESETFDVSRLQAAFYAVSQTLRDVGNTCVPAGEYPETVRKMYELGPQLTTLARELEVTFAAIRRSQGPRN